ncbi:hypothetical protein [Phaeodactylibacter xiamenensis]|uniref:hypothetical protein n=1 Tax=Phaeodactylibacter xiamenensis TaxID=1524460 RepID=UPI0024A8C96F|nr:hypothetical protein [Phaeodactylibacter xiamenensis]
MKKPKINLDAKSTAQIFNLSDTGRWVFLRNQTKLEALKVLSLNHSVAAAIDTLISMCETHEEQLAVIYWFASHKTEFSNRYKI